MTGETTHTLAAQWGGHSMTAPLRRVLVYAPSAPDESVSWEDFGYLQPVRPDQAAEEHQQFRDILGDAGCDVIVADPPNPSLQDAIFPFDPVIMTDAGAILCRMGKSLRAPEVALMENMLADLSIPIAGRIESPGTIEGGDGLWLDPKMFVVGRGYRTNDEGIQQLTAIMAGQGVVVVPVDLPYWHGPGECLHLLSLISMVDADLAVVYLPLLPVRLAQMLDERGIGLVQVPDGEFETQGPNVLATAPRQCVLLRENFETAARLRAEGCAVTLYAGDEISHNRTGGPTCLTRPLLRG